MKNFILLIPFFFISCANVKQIDRGGLARKIMQPTTCSDEKVFLNEVRSFREAAAGGAGSSVGGGCGCN